MSRSLSSRLLISFGFSLLTALANVSPAPGEDLNLLFMGDSGHHRPEARFQQLAPVLEQHDITLQYTDNMSDLNARTLQQFDGLILYANIDHIEDEQAAAVLKYVANGKGFVPIHCATYCWRNNADIVALMGAQFKTHGGRIFTTQDANTNHPIMHGYNSFTSWDETYVHHRHNTTNRTVLEYRVEGEQADGQSREPWTWVRTYMKGRVFYTAWGHDERTWSHPGFHNLIERGIRWACGSDPKLAGDFTDPGTFTKPQMTTPRTDVAAFEYVDVGPKIPNYTPGDKWGVQGKPQNEMQLPLSPEESIKHFVTPEGFVVRRYADERNFEAKPIAMTRDEQGRLWICETVDYPNELGGNRDRIRICNDTDGDHVADQFTVFAENLSIPTAIVIVRGGAVVQNGTETIYLKDLDGDDVADQRTTLITNWALGDTHGGVSNFRYGLDNWIWAMQGYNNSTPHIDGKPTQTFRMGFWRFKLSQTDPPQVTDLEFIRSSNNNTWGLGISEEGLIFGSTANHNPSMFAPIPNRYYERVRGWAPSTLGSIADTYKFKPITDNVRQVDQFGGYTAGAGHALYTARTFPAQWWNRTAFVCGPTGHLVGTFVLRPEGANYSSTSPVNLLASDDEWSAPIVAEVGPDGAVWVIDWYNYIVQHNPTPQGFETGKGNAYVSDLRDKKHGRIYRVLPSSADGDHVHKYASLGDATNSQLVETLRHPSFMWRLHAQRLLVERQARNVTDELVALINDNTVDGAGLNPGAIHALQTLHGLGLLSLTSSTPATVRNALQESLDHPSAGVRRNAIAVLPHNKQGLALLLQHRSLFADRDAQVQLQAWLTLADMPPGQEAASIVARLCPTASDVVLVDAMTAAAATHAEFFLTALCESPTDATDTATVMATRVAEHVARGTPKASQLTTIVKQVSNAQAAASTAILDGLNAGLPDDYSLEGNATFDQVLTDNFESIHPDARTKFIQLAVKCKTAALDSHVEQLAQDLLRIACNSNRTLDSRITACRDLLAFQPQHETAAEQILEQIDARMPPDLARRFLDALRASRSTTTGEAIVVALADLTPQVKSSAIATLLSRPEWVQSLLDGLESQDVELTDLSLDQKQTLQSFPDKHLRKRAREILATGGSLPNADRDAVLQSLLPLTKEQGDAVAGRELFKKHCSKCHIHGDMGTAIGPNLTGMSVHPKAEMLTHIIDPSRSVEGNFRIYTVVRTDGRVANGMLASETRTSITLIDTEAKEASIQRDDIEELVASRKSLMPDGFEKQMSKQELTDLLEFLASQDRYVPLPLDRYATAISTKGMFHQGDDGPDRMIFTDWKPKMVGDVPFVLTDPQGKSRPNIILLNGPQGPVPPKMPKVVQLPCNTTAKAIHLLSGVGGWSYPAHRDKTVSVTVRLHYADGSTEDHPLKNGVHFADYIRRVDVPESKFAFSLRDQQIRAISLSPQRTDTVESIELIKGNDPTAPIIMAVTLEK